MQDFINELKALTTGHGVEASELSINLAIETFSDLRNYPPEYTDDMKLSDMRDNKSKIAMAIVEIDSKEGMENQKSHSENGYNRTFAERILAYDKVVSIMDSV